MLGRVVQHGLEQHGVEASGAIGQRRAGIEQPPGAPKGGSGTRTATYSLHAHLNIPASDGYQNGQSDTRSGTLLDNAEIKDAAQAQGADADKQGKQHAGVKISRINGRSRAKLLKVVFAG